MPSVPLDPDQQAAVDHREGACLVLAGPGSGKTRVIVERFLALRDEGVAPDQQLVLTYTVRAAAEMRERAERIHGGFGERVPLQNFHSFSRQVLREWGWRIGLAPTFRIADPAERWLRLAEVLEEVRPRTLWNPLRPNDHVDALLELIEKAKQELVTPERYAQWARESLATVGAGDAVEQALLTRHAECAEVYARLRDRNNRRGILDHDDCILLCEQLLRTDDAARTAVCVPLRHVMVDEYQDTNLAQARLVDTLCQGHDNVMVVADDDQAIYKFRGASLANLERFAQRHPGHRAITLARNYRSTPQIVATCAALIGVAAARSRRDKALRSTRDDGAIVETWEAPDARSEATAVARLCAELRAEGRDAADIAWLFHRHDDMRPAMAALRELGVPYRVHGGRGFFKQPEIKDLLALLMAIADPRDQQALLRCVHLPSWRVSNAGRLALALAAAAEEAPLSERLRDESVRNALLDNEADRDAALRCAVDLTELHGESLHADVRELAFDAIERSGFLGIDELERDIERVQAGANLGKLAELLEDFAEWSGDLRLTPALRYLEVLRDSQSADQLAPIEPVEDGVELLTAHGAKGLEWPVVVVSRCVEQRWPGRQAPASRLRLPDELVDEAAPEGDSRVDEERRLLYVAMTRARDRLVLTRALRYRESFRDEPQSQFLTAIAADPGAPVGVAQPFEPPRAQRRRQAAGTYSASWPRPGVRDLRDFRECPRRYEYRRRFRMPARPGVHGWYGTRIHAVLERAGRLRAAGGEVGADALVALWEHAWEASSGPKGAHSELREHGTTTLRAYAESAAWTQARIAAVEQPFVLLVEAGEVAGRFDRLDAPAGGVPVVVDYKTGPPTATATAASDLQVRAYAVALSRQEGVEEVVVELHHLQTAEVTRVELDASALRTATGQLGAVAAELAAAWQERRFRPNPSAWRCRRCDYRTICDEGAIAAAAAGD